MGRIEEIDVGLQPKTLKLSFAVGEEAQTAAGTQRWVEQLEAAGCGIARVGERDADQKPKIVRELNGLLTEFLSDAEAVIPIRNPAYSATVTP